MSKLSAFVDDLEKIEEPYRDLYTKTEDGRFRLDADGVEDVTALKNSLENAKREREDARKAREKAEKALKERGDVDPEDYKRLKAEAEKRAEEEAEKKGEWDKLRAQMLEKHQQELKAREERADRLRQALEQKMVDADATAEIAAAKGVPALLLPHVKARVRVIEEDGVFSVRVVNEKGEPRVNGEGSFLTIKDLIAEMRQSDTFARAFDGSGASGSGAPPNGQGGALTGNKKPSEMSVDEKSAWIAKNGLDKWTELVSRSY